MSASPVIRVGVIGAGEHFQRSHLPFLTSPPVAVFDPVKHPNVTWEDFIAQVDAVIIASPDKYHFPQLCQSLQAGKHVFVEKPLVTQQHEAAQIVQVLNQAAEQGLVVSSCHPRRFDPPIVELRRRTPPWNQLTRLRISFSYAKITRHGKHLNLMQDHFSHEIDILRFLFPDAPALNVQDWRAQPSAYRIDGYAGHCRVVFEGRRVLDEKVYHELIELETKDSWKLYNLNSGQVFGAPHDEPPLPSKNYDVMFRAVWEDFLSRVRSPEAARPYLTNADLIANNTCAVLFANNTKQVTS